MCKKRKCTSQKEVKKQNKKLNKKSESFFSVLTSLICSNIALNLMLSRQSFGKVRPLFYYHNLLADTVKKFGSF